MASHAMVHTYELSIPILMTVWLVEFPVTSATLGTMPGIAGITLVLALWGIAASAYHPAGLALISNGVESAVPASPTTEWPGTSVSRGDRSSPLSS